VGLVDSYRLVLQSYLQKRDKPGDSIKGQVSGYKVVVNDALKRLDELDGQREILGRQINAPLAVKPLQPNTLPAPSRPGFGTLKR
jgi:hypothetical protein